MDYYLRNYRDGSTESDNLNHTGDTTTESDNPNEYDGDDDGNDDFTTESDNPDAEVEPSQIVTNAEDDEEKQ